MQNSKYGPEVDILLKSFSDIATNAMDGFERELDRSSRLLDENVKLFNENTAMKEELDKLRGNLAR